MPAGEQLALRIGRYSIVQCSAGACWCEVQCGLATQVISAPRPHTELQPPSSANSSAAKNHPENFFFPPKYFPQQARLKLFLKKGAELYPSSTNFPTIVLPLAIRAILANLVNLMPIQQPLIDTELIRKAANQFQFPSVTNKSKSNLNSSFIT